MEKMRELFVEELESVVGGGPGVGVNQPETTMACCEEGPSGCCWYGDLIEDLIGP